MVIAMIGPTSSRAPTSAASTGVLPDRTCRSTFSTTTIASSTTRPTDSTTARIVSRFRLKPKAAITMAVPMREMGIATSGMSAVRTEPTKRNTTRPTMRTVSASVLVISSSALRMNIVPSQTRRMSMSAGSVGRMRSISARSRAATSISFEPTSGQMPRYTPSSPLRFAIMSASSAPSSTLATSLRRTTAPSRSVTMRLSNSATERRSVLASRLTCTWSPFAWPTAAR